MASYFLEIYTQNQNYITLTEEFRNNIVPNIIDNKSVLSAHLYTPCHDQELVQSDQNPPCITLQFDCKTLAKIENTLQVISEKKWFVLPAGYSVTHQVFEKIEYPLFGESAPQKRYAKISYAVRYSHPISDEKKFVEFYLTHHPQILANMPAIRNVLCYVPLDWDDPLGLPSSNYIVGNEVVFDSLKNLMAAQASDVRDRARDDMIANPVRPGPVTHFALQREDFG